MEKVLTTKNLTEWTNAIEGMNGKDVFDTVEYVALFERYFKQQALLFEFQEKEGRVVHIFFKRKINKIYGLEDIFGKKDIYDLVSPWYFGGFLLSDPSNSELLQKFFGIFKEFCHRNNIVSEFMRLHPMLTENIYLDGVMELKKFNDVVYIDLQQEEGVIWKNMKDTNREKIRKARKNNVEVTVSKDAADIEEFHRLYINAMERKNARSYYFFCLDFFKDILNIFSEDSTLILARHKGLLIGGVIMLGKYDNVYSYLSASIPEFLPLGANNILKYEGAMWAKRKGYKYFILGGGNSIGDSLFKFKSSFSDTYKGFFTGRVIYNRVSYDRLCEIKIEAEKRKGKIAPGETDFFPRYRFEV